ncbi:MAG: hypothetical protein HOI95_03835 [Chromatiales bacterium]|jgi:hypothetical protein|nr:hypothetical protein [Chromatiales bacterium]
MRERMPAVQGILLATLMLTGCGVETVSTAATIAAAKSKEAAAAGETKSNVRDSLAAAQEAAAKRGN